MTQHWLDDIIALVRREGQRHAAGNPDVAVRHETAADILVTVREANVSHDEARARLSEPRDNMQKASGPPPFAG